MTSSERAQPFWIALMYHDVLPPGEGQNYFAVTATRFNEHLAAIETNGYSGVSLGEALSGKVARPVAITFDDATSSQIQQAFPLLLERGMTATFFVVTGWVGRPGYASWEDLLRMKAAGMEVQSHTHSHPFLSELDPREVETELRQSRDILDERMDQETRTLALPGGDFPAGAARDAIAAAGYDVVATSVFGRNPWGKARDDSPRYVRRCTVRGDVDTAALKKILVGYRPLFCRRRVREGILRNLRRGLSPSRYAKWRRRFLDAIGRS